MYKNGMWYVYTNVKEKMIISNLVGRKIEMPVMVFSGFLSIV